MKVVSYILIGLIIVVLLYLCIRQGIKLIQDIKAYRLKKKNKKENNNKEE